jgi:hypothetical protein
MLGPLLTMIDPVLTLNRPLAVSALSRGLMAALVDPIETRGEAVRQSSRSV